MVQRHRGCSARQLDMRYGVLYMRGFICNFLLVSTLGRFCSIPRPCCFTLVLILATGFLAYDTYEYTRFSLYDIPL